MPVSVIAPSRACTRRSRGTGVTWLQLCQKKELVSSLLDSRFYLHIGLFLPTYLSEAASTQGDPTPALLFRLLCSLFHRYARPAPGSHGLSVPNIAPVVCTASMQDPEKRKVCAALFMGATGWPCWVRWAAGSRAPCCSRRTVACRVIRNH